MFRDKEIRPRTVAKRARAASIGGGLGTDCVWYSQDFTRALGMERFRGYVNADE